MVNSKEREIEELLSPKGMPDKIKKKMKVQFDGKQHFIRIPSIIAEELNIKKGDFFIIEYNPETKEYSFKLEK